MTGNPSLAEVRSGAFVPRRRSSGGRAIPSQRIPSPRAPQPTRCNQSRSAANYLTTHETRPRSSVEWDLCERIWDSRARPPTLGVAAGDVAALSAAYVSLLPLSEGSGQL
jgi:hypothetical protein